LVVDALGRPPEPGETVGHQGSKLAIEAIETGRVLRATVERLGPDPNPGDHPGS
jgi:CBS domain containing-hemolysin-like protein